MDYEKLAKQTALENAIKFDGKANAGTVIGVLLGAHPDLKKDMQAVAKIVNKIILEVNQLNVEEQTTLLKSLGKRTIPKKKEHGLFDFFNITNEKVITAFPPEPSKYLQLGHVKAAVLNYLLAKEHRGKFILRLDDTNPDLAKKEFYEMQVEDMEWLGLTPDKVIIASEHLEEIDDYANQLLSKGIAYFCNCPKEVMSEFRKLKKACDHQSIKSDRTVNSLNEGETIRLALDMTNNNTTFRDPAIYRYIDKPHAKVKQRKHWPMYDFETAILDGKEKISHRIRGKEFELRTPLQNYLQELLELPKTNYYEIARFNIEGASTQGREIREGIQSGKYTGWDDPSLVTIASLKRRGFLADALKNFLVSTGINKSESTLTWEDLIKHNRRLLDESANRYFFVAKPVKIIIENSENKTIELNLNPNTKKGGRKITVGNTFYIEQEDYEKIIEGKVYRLMDCINFIKKDEKLVLTPGGIEEFRKAKGLIFHWVSEEHNKYEVLMPDKTLIIGIGEKALSNAKIGEHVQFERYGFLRKDSATKFYYTHK